MPVLLAFVSLSLGLVSWFMLLADPNWFMPPGLLYVAGSAVVIGLLAVRTSAVRTMAIAGVVLGSLIFVYTYLFLWWGFGGGGH